MYRPCLPQRFESVLGILGSHLSSDLSEAIRLDPNHDRAYAERGNCYYVLHQYDKAIDDYNAAVRLNPNDYATYDARASAYEKLGNWPRKIETERRH